MRTAGLLLALAWLGLGGGAFAQGAPRSPPHPPWPDHRFDEDWSVMLDPRRRAGPLDALKAVPLGQGLGGTAHLALGGELRERLESVRNDGFGIDAAPGGGRTNTYLLQRALLHADLRLGPAFRGVVQFGSLTGFGARGGSLPAIFAEPLPDRAAPSLFILLAPPAVGGLAALALNGGAAGPLTHVLFGFAAFVSVLVASLLGRILATRFTVSWWALTFPSAAFATLAVTYAGILPSLTLRAAAVAALGFSTVVVAGVSALTIAALVRGDFVDLPSAR